MKVVCDNCSAVYKVPAEKLTKAVNKATCRNCGHRMLIPRPQPDADPDEQTVVTAVPPTPNVTVSREGSPRQAAAQLAAARGAPSPAAAAVAAAARARAAVSASGRDDLPLATPMALDRTGEEPARPTPAFTSQQPLHPPRHRVPTPPTTIDRASSAPMPIATASANVQSASPVPAAGTGWGAGARRTPTPPGSSPPPPQRRLENLPPRASAPPPMGAAPPHRGAAPPHAAAVTHQVRATPGLPPRVPPAPAGTRGTTPAAGSRHTPTPLSARAHDPGTDLSLALAGTWAALVGSIVLAFLSVFDHPIFLWLGLAMSLGGGAFTVLVLTTGRRGRRPARVFAAAGFATLVAIGAPATLVGAAWFVDQARAAYALNYGDGTAIDGQDQMATITAPATPPDAGAIAAPVVEAPPEPEVEPEPVVEQAPVRRPPPKPAPTRSSTPRPAPSKPAPATPAPSHGTATATATPAPEEPLAAVPIEAIHVMLSSNLDVKRCFYAQLQVGNLPPRVDVRFDILASGAAANVRVVQADQQGTDLESCLARTIGSIAFPATSGKGTTITYPFILQ
jgi:predicted Zn finger-like uncharacterized protein